MNLPNLNTSLGENRYECPTILTANLSDSLNGSSYFYGLILTLGELTSREILRPKNVMPISPFVTFEKKVVKLVF